MGPRELRRIRARGARGVCAITGSDRAHLAGNCSGGALVASLAAHLADSGRGERVAGIMLGVCVIDSERAGTASAFMNREVAAASVADVARKGYLDGRALQGVFAWLRPNDLIWSYVVNNYLLGKQPPAFDILFWNADTTNLAAALHRDLAELALTNALAVPGGMSLLGTPIDLGRVTLDAYIVAGISDHITPWESCYKTTQLLGGESRFVLSTSGHVAALVNPPGTRRPRIAPATASTRPLRTIGSRARASTPAPGGRTGTPGSPSGPARSARRPSHSAAAATGPQSRRRGPTCSADDRGDPRAGRRSPTRSPPRALTPQKG